MKKVLVHKSKHPLYLPEIRTLFASFLDLKDCPACVRVSRDWFNDFAGVVWHTVDLAEDGVYRPPS